MSAAGDAEVRRQLERSRDFVALWRERRGTPGEQADAYRALGAALDAAGYARQLGHPQRQWRADLQAAAQAGAAVFALRGSTVSEVVDLETEATERVVDLSATSPGGYVRAALAALAAGDEPSLERLAAVEADELRSDQVVASALLARCADALRLALGGRYDAAARQRSAAVIEEFAGAPDAAQRSLIAQLEAIAAIAAGDGAQLEDALDGVAEAERRHWEELDRELLPELHLQLALLGLRALAERPA